VSKNELSSSLVSVAMSSSIERVDDFKFAGRYYLKSVEVTKEHLSLGSTSGYCELDGCLISNKG